MEPSEEAKLSFSGPIGVFDSGYGGLSILRRIRERLPLYDYLYLGDNARAPYGPRSFDVVYRFTLEAVRYLFARGCPLVILACNTASAKALRSIQRNDLPLIDPTRRVLGVIRPTVEEGRRDEFHRRSWGHGHQRNRPFAFLRHGDRQALSLVHNRFPGVSHAGSSCRE